jgi:hypothetical protein
MKILKKLLTYLKFRKQIKIIKIKDRNFIPENFTGIAKFLNKTKAWYKEGKCHRENGPAVEFPNGEKLWYKEGKLHRLDGPAIEQPDGTKIWHIEGKIHRLDGPACEYSDGIKKWWVENNPYSPEKLSELINSCFYLGKEKGQYNLECLKFLTEEGIEEFPIIPGMKEYEDFKKVFLTLEEMGNK